MKWNAITRRHFLQGPGGAALALPVLHSLLPGKAAAQAVAAPQKTFIGFAMMNGIEYMYNNSAAEAATKPSVYLPALTNMQAVAGPVHPIQVKSLDAAKTDGGGRISEYFGAEWNPYLSKTLMLNGFDRFSLPSDHHEAHFGNSHSAYSSVGESLEAPVMATIDQLLAYSPGFYKNPALIGKSVNWSGWDYETGIEYSKTFQDPKNKATTPIIAKSYISQPSVLWDAFFKNFTPSTAPKPPPGPGLRSLLVDNVLLQYNAVKANPRLGKTDKVRIDQHIALLHETEKAVKAVPVAQADCTVPVRAGSFTDRRLSYQAMNSLIVSLAACGLCHSFAGSGLCYITGVRNDWHAWSHGNGSNPTVNEHDQIKGLLKDVILDLVAKLDQAALLDSSLVFVPQEHSRRKHDGVSNPIVMFGSAGGVLKTGQYIDYRNMGTFSSIDNPIFGYPMNQAFANVLMALGMPPSEFEPLNRNSNPHFSPGNSGYGHTLFSMKAGYTDRVSKYARFKGRSMSDWLPLIQA